MRNKVLAALCLGFLASQASASRLTFFISPEGKDTASGLSPADPLRSFEKAFSVMDPGDELVLMDGTYGEAAGTGYISYAGLRSAQPPSGLPELPTLVRAKRPGSVKVVGGLFLGRSFRQDHDIAIQGITFEGLSDGTGGSAGALYNTANVAVQDCGFHGAQPMADAILRVGEAGGEGNRLRDVWVWGRAPAAIAVGADRDFSARRVLMRLESEGVAMRSKSSRLSLENVLSLEGDGARWLSPDASLEPWPDEMQIRKDLCIDAGISRGFCSWDSLTRYLRDLQPPPGARIGRETARMRPGIPVMR